MKQYRPILFSFLLLALCLTAACAWDNPSPAPGMPLLLPLGNLGKVPPWLSAMPFPSPRRSHSTPETPASPTRRPAQHSPPGQMPNRQRRPITASFPSPVRHRLVYPSLDPLLRRLGGRRLPCLRGRHPAPPAGGEHLPAEPVLSRGYPGLARGTPSWSMSSTATFTTGEPPQPWRPVSPSAPARRDGSPSPSTAPGSPLISSTSMTIRRSPFPLPWHNGASFCPRPCCRFPL